MSSGADTITPADITRSGLVTLGETMGLLVQTAPGVPRNGEPMSFGIGGSESNVAIGVRRLGVPATWIGRIGDDPAGAMIQRELRAERVEAVAVIDPAPTGLMLRWRPAAQRGRVEYYRRGSAGSHLCAGDVLPELITRARVLHVSGITLALGADPAAAVTHAIGVAREAGVTVSLDLNFRRALWDEQTAAPVLEGAARQADVVFAGVDEAAIIAGTHDPLEAALALEQLGPRQVLIKLGADGCLARINGTTHELAAPRVAVLDTVGAGDAFAAGYLADLIAGAGPAERLATAIAAGAWAVTVSGDWEGMPDRRALGLFEDSEPVVR
ncbi:MAG TPA: sugar kinase [Solirubrobacteraceae bacterium]|nr:sugar kinase [Solirubrobacteraceae bacterium]